MILPLVAVVILSVIAAPRAAVAHEGGRPIEAELCSSWSLVPVDLPKIPAYSPMLSVVRGRFFLSDSFEEAGPPYSLLVSEDLEHWEVAEIPLPSFPRVAIAGGAGVFVGFSMDREYVISSDGLDWEARPIPGGTPLEVYWTGEEFMMVSEGGAFFSSPDGENWEWAGTAPIDHFVIDVAWSGREWLVTDLGGRLISTDLRNWERIGAHSIQAAWGNRRFLVYGSASPIEITDDGDQEPYPVYVEYSEDYGEWVEYFVAETKIELVGDRFGFVASRVGEERIFYRFYASADAMTWYQQPLDLLEGDLPSGQYLNDDIVRYGRHLYILLKCYNGDYCEEGFFFLKGDCPKISGVTVVPGAAHTDGAGGSRWRTDLVLESRAPGEDEVLLEFLPWHRGASRMMRRWIRVPGGRATTLEDVVSTVFGTEGAGTLWIWPQSGGLAVSARTWEEDARTGQGVPRLDWSDALETGERAILTGMVENDAFRTNVGLVNLEEIPIDVVLELRGDGGEVLALIDQRLRARESVQFNGLFGEFAPVDAGSVEIWTPTANGRLLVYGSRIDNSSQDPVWIEPSAVVPPLPEGFDP